MPRIPVNRSGTVRIASNKCAVSKARPKAKGWSIAVCTAIFLLLAAVCGAPSPTAGARDSIRMPLVNGSHNLAIQSRPAGSVSPGRVVRSTETSPPNLSSAAILTADLSVRHSLPRIFQSRLARSPASKFVRSTFKVRAPPVLPPV